MKILLPLMLSCMLAVGCRTNESPEGQVHDLEIETQIKAKLASDIGPTTVPNITVNSTNGVVTLAGQVDSSDIKSRADAIAKAAPRVVRVIDNLQVTTKPQ